MNLALPLFFDQTLASHFVVAANNHQVMKSMAVSHHGQEWVECCDSLLLSYRLLPDSLKALLTL